MGQVAKTGLVMVVAGSRWRLVGGEELGGKKRDVGEQRKRGGTHAFSDLFPLGESSSRCEYCGSSVHIFLLHCSSCIFLDVFSFYSLFGCNFSATRSFFFMIFTWGYLCIWEHQNHTYILCPSLYVELGACIDISISH